MDRVIFYIKDFVPFQVYVETTEQLNALRAASSMSKYRLKIDSPVVHMGTSGVGIDFVRHIRNGFAHGATHLPLPEDSGDGWSGKLSSEPEFIALCTRVVLLTIQMLLSVYSLGRQLDLQVLEDEDGDPIDADIQVVLRRLHIASSAPQ